MNCNKFAQFVFFQLKSDVVIVFVVYDSISYTSFPVSTIKTAVLSRFDRASVAE